MHQALLIPEVLLEIFAYVNERSYTQIRSTQKSLAALATTCKVFYEPAMDLLWAEIYQLEPLLGCVTRLHPLIYGSGIGVPWHNLWAHDVEPLSAHEARQFLRHSARIRKLNISSNHPSRSSHLLSVMPAEACVSPNLRSLTLSTKYLNHFLPHMLHQCHLLTVNESLESVVTRRFTLEHLCINIVDTCAYDTSTADELSLLSDRIRWCTRLDSVTLYCPILDWVAWKHLSYIPTILRVDIDQGLVDAPLLLEQDIINFSPFLNITSLLFHLYDAAYIIPVMQHSQFPSLKEFGLDIDILYSADAEELLRALSHCKATLEKISIQCFYDEFMGPLDTTLTIIPHFLCFTQLRTLQLMLFKSNSCIYLDNDILLEAMSTWPHIHTLEIKDSGFRPSSVSFHGLFTALRLCPQLHTLQLTINTATLDIDPDAELIQHTSLRTLKLEASNFPITNAETLARIIFAWLPCVDQVENGNRSWDEVNTHLTSLKAHALYVAGAS
ncbi:hypothetical protein DFJ58DRAFT_127295 [Suillus subalutaceus]|uniref:uncharacterized protein n=1 Tax=Suillus subalutaceus TaxID=48586 RepID=UPI001B87A4FA|nr:uncharacterized protein DFJ58DRAFT_127295 [Suillus subalutaceus]KAG1867158.1 hypothetical protein DFJ58DRAFT_127295 [Suillus subalutaceus]